jgi:ketosteroid isomerase-like protein
VSGKDVASDFVAALADSDIEALRALLAPDASFWVNIGSSSFSVDERLAVLEQERSHLVALTFEGVRTQATPTGFVVQLTTVATTTAGTDLRIPVCLVATADGDRVSRVEEYADSAEAAPLLRLMYGGR